MNSRGSQARTEGNDWTILTYFTPAVCGSCRIGTSWKGVAQRISLLAGGGGGICCDPAQREIARLSAVDSKRRIRQVRMARRATCSAKLDSPNSVNNVQYVVVTKTQARARLPIVTDQRGSSRAVARKTKENKRRPASTSSESTRHAT